MVGSPFPVDIDKGLKVGHLKDVIKDKNSDIPCPARNLKLFLTKTEGGWLSANDGAVVAMGRGDIHGQDAPSKQTIHVLVKAGDLPAPFPPWDLAPTQFPPLTFDRSSPLHHIPATYAVNSGLPARKDGLMLYLREGVTEEWDALLNSVVKTYAQLWIISPPGTGKSLAAFAFACSLNRVDTWDVLWISYPKANLSRLRCILFQGEDEKRTCLLPPSDLNSLLGTLRENTIIFLDGYAGGPNTNKAAPLTSCEEWRSENKQQRCLVVVASMVSLGTNYKPSSYEIIPESGAVDHETFNLYSWTLKEYKEALTHDDMFRHVMKVFGVNDLVPIDERMNLVTEKFFIVGGSARMMFDRSTDQAKSEFNVLFDSIRDVLKYMEGTISVSSPQTINRLVAWYPTNEESYPLRCIVSSFVAREIAQRVGPERLQKLADTLVDNPAMDGYMLEMWFFSSLRHEGLQLYEVDARGIVVKSAHYWSAPVFVRFDPESDDPIPLHSARTWFKPRKWNNGGFDAVFVDFQDIADTDTTARQAGCRHKLHVRFVQVTRSETHSYKAEFFKHLLTRFKASMGNSLWISRVEVCFVVPIKLLKTFTIPVDKRDFRRDVVDPVTRSNGVPGTTSTRSSFYEVPTDVSIRVVGIKYDLLETTGDKRQRRG